MSGDCRTVLIVFSGLPGIGKTTIAKLLCARLRAFYLRIDTIEQAMKAACLERVGPAGYTVAHQLAAENLTLGHSVVADCVNPVRESRARWREVAMRASARLVDIYLICSDPVEHRRRVEERAADIKGHVLPNWDAVLGHQFEPWTDECLLLDTAVMSPAELVIHCEDYVLSSGSFK